MCLSCVHDALCDGDPYDDENPCGHVQAGSLDPLIQQHAPATPEMIEVATLVHDWYEVEPFGAGGPLHIQLDDFNLEDEFLTPQCLEDGWKFYAEDRTPEHEATAERIRSLLAGMTEPQRHLAIAAQYWPWVAELLGMK